MFYKFIFSAVFLLIDLNYAYAYADANSEISADKALALQKLQQATTAYRNKHDVCNQKKKRNVLTSKTKKMLQSLSEETLQKGIMYISAKAFERCLQPERGELAERLLQAQSWPNDKKKIFDTLMFTTMESTRKLVFDISISNTEVSFHLLTAPQKQSLLGIPAMQIPFDTQSYWEASLAIR